MALVFNFLALALTVMLGWLYLHGIEEGLFWTYAWFDVLLHFMGGLVMGLWACAVAVRLSLPAPLTFFCVLGVALGGGVAWEVFEHTFDLAGGAVDTVSDLVLGLFGALSVLVIYLSARRFRHEH